MPTDTSREGIEALIAEHKQLWAKGAFINASLARQIEQTLAALLDERDHAIKIASERRWNRSELEQRLRELEAIRAWANSDLEHAQPKYGEYAEGLLMAQEVVRAILADTDEGDEQWGTDDVR